MKTCSDCGETKPFDAYHKDKNSSDGRTYSCKQCANARSRKHHADNKEDPEYQRRMRGSYFKYKYGISLEEYEQKVEEQNHQCAICGTPIKTHSNHTHLDHDHETGALRGMLCTNCNRGLGHFQDSEENLRKAIDYLLKWREL